MSFCRARCGCWTTLPDLVVGGWSLFTSVSREKLAIWWLRIGSPTLPGSCTRIQFSWHAKMVLRIQVSWSFAVESRPLQLSPAW